MPCLTGSCALAVAEGYKYAKSHEWAKVDGDVATVGISDHAQVEGGVQMQDANYGVSDLGQPDPNHFMVGSHASARRASWATWCMWSFQRLARSSRLVRPLASSSPSR